jgi:hypothetical protein
VPEQRLQRQLDVLYEPGAGWHVRHHGGDDELVSSHDTLYEAEAAAVRHAREHDEHLVAVHGTTGAVLWMRPVR